MYLPIRISERGTNYFVSIVLLALVMITIPCAANTQGNPRKSLEEKIIKWYKYAPASVTLTGTLTERIAYGPPGYGENPKKDKKVRYFVLELKKPINIKGDTSSEFNQDTFLRINILEVDPINGEYLDNFVGKIVKIEGQLNERQLAIEHTKVILDLYEIKIIKVPSEKTKET